MITEHQRHISYICPVCHTITTRPVTPSVFSGRNSISVICTNKGCSTPCLNIHDCGGTYTVEVSCMICGGIHSSTISKKHFWNDSFNAVNCDDSGIDIMFIGDSDKMRPTWQKFEQDCDALEVLSESFFENFEADTDDENLAELLYEILDTLSILSEINGVQCKCGSHNVSFTVVDNKIGFRCSKCRSVKIEEPTAEFLGKLLLPETYTFND